MATNIGDGNDFSNMQPIASGTLKNAGYYTIEANKQMKQHTAQFITKEMQIKIAIRNHHISGRMAKFIKTEHSK